MFPQKELDLDLTSHMSYVTIEQLSKTEKEKTPLRLWSEKREYLLPFWVNSKSIIRVQKAEFLRENKKTFLVFASGPGFCP